jgi:hypothetical protein
MKRQDVFLWLAPIGAALNRGVRVVLVLENDEASVGKVSFNPLPTSAEANERPLRCTNGRFRNANATSADGTGHFMRSSP